MGAITIDYESRKIYLDGNVLKVTAKEFDLMEYFIKHKGMILSRDKILDSVWDMIISADTAVWTLWSKS